VEHRVHRPFDVDVARDVVADELEILVTQVRHVGHVAGEQIVDPDHGVPAGQQLFAQMGADEAGCAGDDGSWHRWLPPRDEWPSRARA
jgi:hypothetical protein